MIPTRLIEVTCAREGEAGRRWLDSLPDLIGDYCARWNCRIDGPAGHGEVALVLPVIVSAGPAVLKLSFPHPGNRGEALALRCFAGEGAVRLIAASDDGFALLLERAGPHTLAERRSAAEAIEIAGGLARRLAVPAPAVATSLADTCPGWLDQLEQQLRASPDALASGVVDRARNTIRELAHERTPTMMHGDLHAGNVLSAEREPWLAIDPKGWSGSAAFDAFTVILGRSTGLSRGSDLQNQLLDRIRRFADAAGVDTSLAVACCQARAVSSYLYQLQQDGDWFALDLLRTLTELTPPSDF